jgi:molybdenum cofactor cytidylyltransferase
MDSTRISSASAVILMAGKSMRFGAVKGFQSFDDHSSFLSRLISIYTEAGIRDILVVVNAQINQEVLQLLNAIPQEYRPKLVINPDPSRGKISSIQLGIECAQQENDIFLQNSDNPFTSVSLILGMRHSLVAGNYVVPVYKGKKGHPILLSRTIANKILDETKQDINLKSILPQESMHLLETNDEGVLANINTTSDYRQYFAHEIRT